MKLSSIFSQRRHVLHGRPEDSWRSLIAERARGRSFIDLGCLWNVHGAYAFHAVDHGAGSVTGVDVNPATPPFLAENTRRGNPVRFVQADINDPHVETLVGHHEVVFCSGVLYHVPDPLFTIGQLRRICTDQLILTSFLIPEQALPQAAVYFPYLDDAARAAVQRSVSFRTARHMKRGLDNPFEPERDYANWFWGLSGSCMRALLETAGFEIVEFREHRYVGTAVCRVGARASAIPARVG